MDRYADTGAQVAGAVDRDRLNRGAVFVDAEGRGGKSKNACGDIVELLCTRNCRGLTIADAGGDREGIAEARGRQERHPRQQRIHRGDGAIGAPDATAEGGADSIDGGRGQTADGRVREGKDGADRGAINITDHNVNQIL